MQDSLRLSREEIIICYKDDVTGLLKFLPWLEKTSGGEASGIYSGEGIGESSMPVPVYDSTLLSFIKEIRSTDFMNRNYVYTFSRYRIKTAKDELRVIEACSLQEISVLGDILSKYVLRGDVRGAVWSEGVSNGVYLALLLKLKDLMEIKNPLA
ncbi:MAG: hypothetical protein LUE96_04000 [Lachnospiraceae bacterium]|nr:hypothetical protein [Lachnospiraceae bacterium]